MNVCLEDVRVHNDHAIRCSIVCKPVDVVDYVKAVSSMVGASHILAVFEERDSVKIFFKEKRFVDTVMKSCVHVMGHHVKVDYVNPPGTRLVLTDVDPVISNFDVMRLLSVYGTVVSPVFRPPISEDTELCHIGYGVRYVYINLTTENVPEKIEFKYGENIFSFKIHVESSDVMMLADIKVDPIDNTFLENENSNSSILSQDVSSPPVLVSVQSVNSDEERTTPTLLCALNALQDANQNQGSGEKKRRGRPPNSLKKKRITKTLSATSNAARKIKRNVNHKWIRRRYRKGTVNGKRVIKTVSPAKRTFRRPSLSSSSCISNLPDLSTLLGEEKEEHIATEKVLKKEQLSEFLHEVKNHRAPLELVKKYVGDDCDSINKFIEQLRMFRKEQTEMTLKNRIWRLVKSLSDSLNSSNQSTLPDMMD